MIRPASRTGEVTEWPIVLVSKTSVPARVPRVRIPASPLAFDALTDLLTASRLATPFLIGTVEVRTEHNFGDIVGESKTLGDVLTNVETVATTDSAVLICGETETG